MLPVPCALRKDEAVETLGQSRTSLLSIKVELKVNGEKVDINMKLGDAGEAFFVVEAEVFTYLTQEPRTLRIRYIAYCARNRIGRGAPQIDLSFLQVSNLTKNLHCRSI